MNVQANRRTRQFTGVRVLVDTPVPFTTVLDRLRALMGRASIPDLVALARERISEAE